MNEDYMKYIQRMEKQAEEESRRAARLIALDPRHDKRAADLHHRRAGYLIIAATHLAPKE